MSDRPATLTTYAVEVRRETSEETYEYESVSIEASTSTEAEDKAEGDDWEAYQSSPLCHFCEPSPHGTNDADYHIWVNLGGPDEEQKGMVWACHMHFNKLQEVLP